MTGSGAHAVEAAAGRVEAEARAVNHRFLKSTVRTHGPLPSLNEIVEQAVRDEVRRGHVTVHVRLRPGPQSDPAAAVDDEAFGTAARHLSDLAARHGLAEIRARDVLAIPGVIADTRTRADDEALRDSVSEAVRGAVAQLQASREREGAHMAEEVVDLLDRIALAVAALSQRAGEVPGAYKARLQKRLAELLEGTGVEPDPAQIARECAVLADRSDVREEIARLEAHVAHARALLHAGGPLGRRLDFLAQELHREANTVASKTGDLSLSQTVLDLRAGVERLREQVQNLE
jgi:uncharacterized protein (TIGR00255 family)